MVKIISALVFISVIFITYYFVVDTRLVPIDSINTDKKVIAFTFDDGCSGDLETEIAEVFENNGGHATFFNIGKKAEGNENIIRRTLANGHEIGNHTMSHTRLPNIKSDMSLDNELLEFQKIYKDKFNYNVSIFRAPFLDYGNKKDDNRVCNILRKLNLPAINASIYSNDAKANVDPQSIIDKIGYSPKNGSIVLCHERKHTLEAMKILIPNLKKEGYKFITVSQLLNIN